jgi:hypothetical protein
MDWGVGGRHSGGEGFVELMVQDRGREQSLLRESSPPARAPVLNVTRVVRGPWDGIDPEYAVLYYLYPWSAMRRRGERRDER